MSLVSAAASTLATVRRWAYDQGLLAVSRAPIPVVSVGSVTMGGAGKTPVAGLLARRLQRAGMTVGLVCGAYPGSVRRGPPAVVPPGGRDAVARYGDEAVMLARWLEGWGAVMGGRDKLGAARLAASTGANVVVVDDGFQHRRLARDLDILVHDGQLGASEPGADADLLWQHLRDGTTHRAPGRAPDVVSRYVPLGLLDGAAGGVTTGGPRQLSGRRVCLMAAIAAPEGFRSMVQDLGARVVGQVFIRDHCLFGRRHFRRAEATGAELLLCTEKDLVRMTGRPGVERLVALSCGVEILCGEQRLEQALRRVIELAAPSPRQSSEPRCAC